MIAQFMHRIAIFIIPVILVLSCKENAPIIISINPPVAMPGDVVSIHGSNFGAERKDSLITLDGNPLISSSYLAWADNSIQFKVPEIGRSGLIFVYKGGKRSNSSLFAYAHTIPKTNVENKGWTGPYIREIEPNSAPTGSIITISGNDFGTIREGGAVFFPWDFEPKGQGQIEASKSGTGYMLWSDREIKVQVPDGSGSGNIEVRTALGNSNPVYFNLDGSFGDKAFTNRQSYIVSYSVNVQVRSASAPNSLYLWVPIPSSASSQPHVELLYQDTSPFVENYQGTSLFRFSNLASSESKSINLSYLVTVYEVKTSVKDQTIPQNASLYMPVSSSTQLIPSGDRRISSLARSLVGQERNPYLKAKALYEWLIKTIVQSEPLANRTLFDALDEQKTDAYSASLLFCALARSTGIQAIPIAGVLVDKNRSAFVHHWAEFWIDGLGWIPVDLALGAGIAPDYFDLPSYSAEYYFGNVDSRRIIFSRGELNHTALDSLGRRTNQSHSYALQNYWEEASGGIEAYSSLWSDIQIKGVYNE